MPRKAGTGCITCRIRRIKCDEAKPACQRCITSRRQCDGYLPEDSTVTRRQLAVAVRELGVVGPVSQAFSVYPGDVASRSVSPTSMPLFDVFRSLTAPSTASFMPSDFWTREMLQLAHSEPAVWHATLALGALHRRRELLCSDDVDTSKVIAFSRQAMESHAESISRAKDLKDPKTLLALSLALMSITNFMGNWTESQVHVRAAHRLLRQLKDQPSTKNAAEMLTRLDLGAMTFSDSSAPYSFTESTWLAHADFEVRKGGVIESYGQAATTLIAMLRRCIILDEALGAEKISPEKSQALWEQLKDELLNWETQMEIFEREHFANGSSRVSVLLYHTLIRALISVKSFGLETRWDSHLGYFERMLDCIDCLLSFQKDDEVQRGITLEPGMTLPLFICALKCRHPRLRRKIVARLLWLRRQEGMWNSEGAAGVAKKIATVEEDGLYAGMEKEIDDVKNTDFPENAVVKEIPWETWSKEGMELPAVSSWEGLKRIPEGKRVLQTMVMVSAERKQVELRMVLCPKDPTELFGEVLSETVDF